MFDDAVATVNAGYCVHIVHAAAAVGWEYRTERPAVLFCRAIFRAFAIPMASHTVAVWEHRDRQRTLLGGPLPKGPLTKMYASSHQQRHW